MKLNKLSDAIFGGVKLTPATLKLVDAIARTVQPMLESQGTLRDYLRQFLNATYKPVDGDGKAGTSVKFAKNETLAKTIVLLGLEKAGLFNIEEAKEHANDDRKKWSKADAENVRKYQSTVTFIARAIKLANGDPLTESSEPTVDGTVSSLVTKAGKFGTKAAQKTYLKGVRDGLTKKLASM